jgi:hypothetical protein
MSITREEIWELFFPEQKKQPPKVAKSNAAQTAAERWAPEAKPIAAAVREEAATNAALVERLRREREEIEAERERQAAERRRAWYQAEIDRVWANQRAMQASLRDLRWDPTGNWGRVSLACERDPD